MTLAALTAVRKPASVRGAAAETGAAVASVVGATEHTAARSSGPWSASGGCSSRSHPRTWSRSARATATRLFTIDHSALPWVAGTFDGEDLASYLLDLQPERPRRTHGEVRHDRLDRIERMQSVIHDGPASGIVRYELAALYELENRHIEALRLYTLNRLQYPYFHRNTYRFAGSLSMLAGAIDDVWRERGTGEDARELRTTRPTSTGT